MKILAVADEECKALWDYFTPDKLEGVELIIACGDLSRHYLEYLATMAPVPLLYVHGNHDESYDTRRRLAVYRGRDEKAHQPSARQDRPPWRH